MKSSMKISTAPSPALTPHCSHHWPNLALLPFGTPIAASAPASASSSPSFFSHHGGGNDTLFLFPFWGHVQV